MKTVREMFVSLTAMLINHIWASIIEICVEKWRTKSLKKLKFKSPDMRNGIDLRRLPPQEVIKIAHFLMNQVALTFFPHASRKLILWKEY